MSKKILITGGSGYIGSNLVRELLKRDFEIYAIFNKTPLDIIDENIHIINYDGTLDSLLKINVKVDVIVHLATCFAPKHSPKLVDEMFKTNLLLGIHLLEFAKEKGIKSFVNTSTYAQSIDESDYNPQNLYSATKEAFEDILKYYADSDFIRCITLSLYDTYGPNDSRPKFINLVLEALTKNEIFNMSPGNQTILYVYIDDTVKAFCMAIELLLNNQVDKSTTFSVYGDECFTLNEMVKHISDIFNKDLKTNPGFYDYRDREIMNSLPKFQRIPNWKPEYNLEAGIKKILLQNESNSN